MKKYLITIAIVILGAGCWFYLPVFGDITKQIPIPSSDFQNFRFFATSTNQTIYSTSTTAVSTNIIPYWTTDGRKDSGYFVTAGAEEVVLYFTSSAIGKFDIDISDNGTNWYDYNYLRGNDVALTATTTATVDATTKVYLMQDGIPYAIRCTATVVSAGNNSCRASASW